MLFKAFSSMHSQRDGLELELMVKKEVEHKSLENLQPGDVTEKKNPFSEEKFKPATKICISNKKPNVNCQDDGENVSRACQRSSQQPHPITGLEAQEKKWFPGPGPQPCCFVQSQDLVPCIPTGVKMGQRTAQAIASEGASPKPWQLTHGIGPVGA
uniref:Uncharacterized protein n=1 Tax=Macaca fascicularis TaxID=9541 RepID=A0A7N9CNB6_MACFA